jgi:predicted TIM-barrel fold metal-dependent hydrolase
MIIDAHVHILDRMNGRIGRGETRSLERGMIRIGEEELLRLMAPMPGETRFPPEVLLECLDWAGVDRAVLLQGPFYGEKNDYLHQAIRQWPDRFIGAAYVDPMAENAREMFRRAVDELGFPIIKLECSVATGLVGLHPDLRLDDPRHAWLWDEAERRRLVVTLDLGAVGSTSYQTAAVASLIDRHPDLRIVIAHLGQPALDVPGDETKDRLWQEQVLLGRHPNVWLDLASLPAYAATAGEEYPYPSAQRAIRRAVEMVGADTLLWGTDAPGLLGHATYPQLLQYLVRHCEFLSAADRTKLLGENAWHVYGTAGEAPPLG